MNDTSAAMTASARLELRSRLLERRLRGSAQGQPASPAWRPIQRGDGQAEPVLSFGQERLWFLEQLSPGSPEYVVPLALRLRGRLDLDALERALAEVIARHEILRTRYVLADEGPRAVIDPAGPVSLRRHDLGEPPPAEADQRLRELIEAECQRGFDLTGGPVLRACVIRQAAADHVIVLTVHHIACDGWSMTVLADELQRAYAAFASGTSPALAPLPVRYADFARWQRESWPDLASGGQLGYWREQLAGLAPTPIPADRPRPAVRDWRGGMVRFDVPAVTARRLADLGRSAGATPFMALVAALKVLLTRLAGTEDIAVGVPVAGRDRPELGSLVGFFVNTLVLRTRVPRDEPFTSVLARVRDTAIDAYAHQDIPFEKVVDALRPERDLSGSPLFNVGFTFQNVAPVTWTRGGLEGWELPVLWSSAKAELSVEITELADGSLAGAIVYATALFDDRTATLLAARYARLLDSAAADPGQPCRSLELRTDDELRQLTESPEILPDLTGGRRSTLTALFEAQAARTPGALALTDSASTLTYSELNVRANRLAQYLIEQGAGPERLVAVALPRTADLIVAILAVLKSGAAYLPIDPGYPPARVAAIIEDAKPALVLRTADAALPGVPAAPLDDQDFQRLLGQFSGENPAPRADPDNAAYVIFTSGSTGRPKGVVVPHQNVVRLFESAESRFDFGGDDVWTLFHSVAFDFSVWEMWGALLYGGRLVVVPFAVSRSPEDFLRLLREQGVTRLNQTPSAFYQLIAAAENSAAENSPGPLSLRQVIFGGEALDQGRLRDWYARSGAAGPLLVNMYGITETTVHVTYHALSPGGRAGVIGAGLPHLAVYVLDDDLRPAPAGMVGEVFVAGAGLARGYLGRPDLTAERFIPDPHRPGRMYRTGDLARRLPGGELEYAGRADSQIQLRGFRIELGEIESVLARCPGAGQVAVIAAQDEPGSQRLIAYVTGGADPLELREYASAILPGYMIPAVIMAVSELPLTDNGKLDRAALPAPPGVRGDGDYLPPRTAAQARVAGIWAAALGLDRVGADDNFFQLGGDSIRAVRLVGLLRSHGLAVSVQDLFRYQSVAALTRQLEGKEAPEADSAALAPFALLREADRAGLPAGIADAYPIAEMQAGMIYELLADEELNLYQNVTTYHISDDEPFSASDFSAAGQVVIDRHEALRTSFDLMAYSEPLQLVHASVRAVAGVQDLRHLSDPERRQVLSEFAAAGRGQRPDLGQPPLVHFHAHLTGETEWKLSVTEFHGVIDGWSHHSMITELLHAYRAKRSGQEPPAREALPAPRYADFVALERATVSSAEQQAFWAARVGAAERLTIPGAWQDEQAGDVFYDTCVPILDLEPGLRKLARAAGVSPKTVLLAAHLVVMRTLAGGRACFSGLICNGRPESRGGDEIYGMFLNTVPFGVDSGASTWRQLARDVFAEEIALWPFRRFPLAAAQRAWGAGSPLVQVIFNYLDFHVLDRELVDVDDSDDFSPNEFPLHVWTERRALMFTANARYLARPYGELLGRAYRTVLEAMAADPDGAVLDSALPPDERHRLTTTWNDAAVVLPDRPVHLALADLAAADPDAIAFRAPDASVSRAGLDARAAGVARRLRALGTGPGDLVGVCLPRSAGLVAALLGVLKSGAAYVPLDPAHPDDRRAWIASDAGLSAVITEPGVTGWPPGCPVLHPDGPAGADPDAPVPDFSAEEAADPSAPAYVIYTSGSTGQPKGVVVPHRALTNFLHSMARTPGLGRRDVLVAVTTVSFDIAGLELFLPLLTGAGLVIASQDEAADPEKLGALLTGTGATVMQATPATWRLLADSGWRPSSAFTVLCGGERLPANLARQLSGLADTVWDLYGPTETTIWSSAALIGQDGTPILAEQRRWSPVANTEIYVLGPGFEPVPVGVAGQVCIGGSGLADGYVHRPGLTADRFRPDPHSARPGGRIYLTGDLGRRRPDGSVEILGRTDDQVKIRGYRIEPAEIEAALIAHPAVTAAAVRAVPDADQLAAYLVCADGHDADPAELRRFLARTLPEYLIPAAFVTLSALPLTPNGKVDRKALPAPGPASRSAERYAPPGTATERALAAVWTQVLGTERIGARDDFFALGGHSLLALRAVSLLRANYGQEIAFRDLVEHRPLDRLAEAIDTRRTGEVRALLWFRRTGASPPLYCMHPGGGSGHWFGELAEYLPDDLPVAAFEWPGLNGGASQISSAGDVAERYLAEVRAHQPHGPYRLLGWCGGGVFAWEIAQRLRAAGEPVTLMLLDAAVDTYRNAELRQELDTFGRGEELIRDLLARPAAALLDPRLAELRQIADEVVESDEAGMAGVENLDEGWLRRVRAWRQLLQASLAYRFPPYPGDLHVISGDELAAGTHVVMSGSGYADRLDRWRELTTGTLHVHRMPGDHFGVLTRPHVLTLAGIVERIIRQQSAREAESDADR